MKMREDDPTGRVDRAFSADVLGAIHDRVTRTVWGSWTFSPSLTLYLDDHQGHCYEVDLERCRSAEQVLDWIFQIRQKSWATPTIMSDLLDALEDTLGVQANLCLGGASKTINPRAILKTRIWKEEP